MTKSDLELLLREAGTLARDRDFFLFGSQSLRAMLKHKLVQPTVASTRIADLPISAARQVELKKRVEELVVQATENRAKSPKQRTP